MKKLYQLLIVLACISCEKFLDQVPRYNLTLENAVTDYNGALNVLNGMYSVIEDQSALGGVIPCRLSSQGGFYQYYTAEYNAAYQANYGTGQSVWLAYYALVNSTNAAIEALSGLADNKYPSPERKAEMIAEARCMRAWANANLFWLFGHWWEADDVEHGLLYRDKMSDLGNLQVARLTVGESYTKIFEDLEAAIAAMPAFTSPRYLSRQMAQVLKAKLLLYRGAMRQNTQDLKDALEIVLALRGENIPSWGMESDIVAMYAAGWNSKEVLWARYLGDKSNIANSDFDYSYNVGYRNVYYTIPDGWLKADARYPLVMGNARAPETWDESIQFAVVKLYHGGRYATPNAPYTAYYFRYAELYLMESELKARLDEYSVAEALAPVNEMRAKRTNPVLPAFAAASKKDLLRLLFQEICMEQFLENGSEYFASLRFINDTDASPAQGKPWIYTLKQDVNFTENQYCWPIPEAELNKNTRMIPNPGYN
ncbi:MAG: RagB/SusD family nutrient uptake outer membrane protein [Odoribacteraceae bacterium]|jgi:hypothetical protein|nr:RagB/SusD family nutrient uptake outer membrane protein [Odoribacteraceae bacterium]